MKKSILCGVFIALLTSVLFITACKNDSPSYDGRTDTVVSLGKPKVNGKTYPGVNYIYWDKVANAKNGYDLCIYNGDVLQDNKIIHLESNKTYYVDTYIQEDGMEKTYKVVATGDSEARALYYTESASGSVKLKSILPSFSTKPLDLAAFENPASTSSPLTSEAIEIIKNDASNAFSISFPAKPYLKYTVYADCGNASELFNNGTHDIEIGTYQNLTGNSDGKAVVNGTISTSGNYTFTVKVSSINNKYFNSTEIVAKETLSFDSLDLSTDYVASNIKISYESSTKAVVSWTPGKLANGEYIPANYYSLHKSITGTSTYGEKLDVVIACKENGSGGMIYSFTDTLKNDEDDFSVGRTYLFVVTDGKNTAKYNSTYKAAPYYDAYTSGILDNSNFAASYIDSETIKITWTPGKLKNGAYIDVNSYILEKKQKGAPDSDYQAITNKKSSSTIFGGYEYYAEDIVSNNKVAYTYRLSFEEDSVIKSATITVGMYKETYESVSITTSIYYTSESEVRLVITPTTINGVILNPTDYTVYRKELYAPDSAYTKLTATINETKNQDNATVYYLADSIEDNTSAYSYAILYKNDNKVCYKTLTLNAYASAVVYSIPSVVFVADDSDGILNDAKVTLSVSPEQVIDSVNYIKLDSKTTTNLLLADYLKPLAKNDATVTGNTYEWIIKDVEENAYISVAAFVDGNAKYATTSTASASEPATSVSTTNSSVTVSIIDADDDGSTNDAEVFVTLADSNKILAKLSYAVADSVDDAKTAALEKSSETIDEGYVVYHYLFKDVVTKSGDNIAVAAVISEEGKKDSVIYGTSSYSSSKTITVSDVKLVDDTKDGRFNDIYFTVKAAPEQKLTIDYAIGTTAENAKKLLNSKEVKNLCKEVTGFSFYEFSSSKYSELADIDLGKYIAFSLTAVSEMTSTVEKVFVSSAATYDSLANVRTDAPILNASFLDLDEDGFADDLYATIELYQNQTYTIYYTKATSAEYAANNNILKDRCNSENIISISGSDISEKYKTEDKVIYELKKDGFDVGDRVLLVAVASETNMVDNSTSKSLDPVSDVVVTIPQTAAPSLSSSKLYLTANDNDSKYDDLREDEITVSIDVNQTIKSIRYVFADSIDSGKTELLREGSTLAKTTRTPSEYDLETSVSNNQSKLTKHYIYKVPSISVPLDQYAVFEITISEPGHKDVKTYLTTTAYKYQYTQPVQGELSIPAYATQLSMIDPTFTISDGKNYEYIKVKVQDYFINDNLNNYKYELQYTYEDKYKDDDTVWQTFEDSNVSLSYDEYTGYYTYTHFFAQLPVGTYVVRLTKTRKATASITGKEETIVKDSRVNLIYHVKAPSITFSSFQPDAMVLSSTEYINPDYETLDMYDYKITYSIEYTDQFGITDSEPTIFEITDFEWEASGNGYYTLKNAVIKDLNKDGMSYANIIVGLSKTRVIETRENDSSSTSAFLSWGIGASIAGNDSISISINDESLPGSPLVSLKTLTNPTIDFDSYKWYLNGSLLDESTDSSISFSKDKLLEGDNDLLLVVKKNGVSYSARKKITK
ncbi:MAG: hypothetical protein MJ188_02750 [Treponema sp.]|nr:hypothetical protein [Treponema sp.]